MTSREGLLALLSLVSVGALLGLLELGLWALAGAGWVSLPRPQTLPDVLAEHGYELDRELLFRRSPGFSGSTPPGVRFTTNALGLRGPEIGVAKPPGTFRILALGDSTVFGFGVAFEQTFSQRLERLLDSAWPDTVVEVINAGIPGYSIFNSLAYLERDGVDLDPDLIVLQTNFNDRRYVPSWSRQDSRGFYAWTWLRETLRAGLLHSRLYRLLDRMFAGETALGAGERTVSIDLGELHSRVSPDRFSIFLAELLDFAQRREIGVVLLPLRGGVHLRDYDEALEQAERGATQQAIESLEETPHPFLRITAAEDQRVARCRREPATPDLSSRCARRMDAL